VGTGTVVASDTNGVSRCQCGNNQFGTDSDWLAVLFCVGFVEVGERTFVSAIGFVVEGGVVPCVVVVVPFVGDGVVVPFGGIFVPCGVVGGGASIFLAKNATL